ncbi:MAG: MoxR family ATPase [Spirochaetes bacterium]|jgi:MoxR-like ATPase|nr:MoxR family ATPase [Spirochaetota bacterium]
MDYAEIEKLSERVKEASVFAARIREEIGKIIIGQERLVERIIIAFISGGHVLLEGLPGLAKTLTVRAFARSVDAGFSRIQFTPDLLPADLIGTRIYNPKELDFFTRKGPVFTNILLADEVNRAPAKVQSALLQAMEEHAVTIGGETHVLPAPFMVLATQNPIEQEGTYPLPEAQVDRFFMKCLVGYPADGEEKELLRRYGDIDLSRVGVVTDAAALSEVAALVGGIYIDERLIDYIVNIVRETRNPASAALAGLVEFGASPRASIALMKAARCMAFLRGRGYVTPDDVKEVGADVLRHRVVLSYEAEAARTSADDIVKTVFDSVEVP